MKTNKLLSLLGLLSLTFSLSLPAVGATFNVTKAVDTDDGSCDADCSLREAIIAANNSPGADTVDIPPNTYALTRGGLSEDSASTGDLDILGDTVLNGQGINSTIIDGSGLGDRLIHIIGTIEVSLLSLTLKNGIAESDNGGALYNDTAKVTLNSVNLDNNKTTNEGGLADKGVGGGLHNVAGTVELINCVVGNNVANINQTGRGDRGGGGIFNGNKGTMTLRGTIVSANRTTNVFGAGQIEVNAQVHVGGGILNLGTLYVLDLSKIGGDDATGGNSSFNGGGIANFGGFLTVSRSTISFNKAEQIGGGVATQNQGENDGNVVITNTMISNNDAASFGGGIANSSSPLTVTQSTINGNKARLQGGGLVHIGRFIAELTNITFANNTIDKTEDATAAQPQPPRGAAIFTRSGLSITNNTIYNNTATYNGAAYPAATQLYIFDDPEANNKPEVTFANTIIAHDSTKPELATNCGGDTKFIISNHESGGHNIDSGNSCNFMEAADRTNTDPLLDTTAGLLNNGGDTLTVALQTGSPAIDAADAAYCPTRDQRFYARVDKLCDIGAFELGGSPGASTLADVKITLVDDPDPVVMTEQLQYRITISNVGPDAATGVKTVTKTTFPSTVEIVFMDARCTNTANIVTCNVGDIAAFQSVQLIITVKILADFSGPTLTTTMEVTSADPNTDYFTNNNSATVTTTVIETGTGGAGGTRGKRRGSVDLTLLVLLASSVGFAALRRARERRNVWPKISSGYGI